MTSGSEDLHGLAERLAQRRPEILRAWHRLVGDDPELTTASSISRAQFYDHIPQLLDAFEHRLRAESMADKNEASAEEKKSAAEHGLHRWQQGYNQSETMREWAHLHLCLLDELERQPEVLGSGRHRLLAVPLSRTIGGHLVSAAVH